MNIWKGLELKVLSFHKSDDAHRFGINAVSNLLTRLWNMVAVYLFIPLYIRFLGESAYGLVSFFATLQTTMNLLGLGLSNTLRREFAVGTDSPKNAQRKYMLLRSVEFLYFCIAILIFLICFSSADYISSRWLNIEELPLSMVRSVIAMMGLSIALQLVSNLYVGCLFGLECQSRSNLITILWSVIKYVCSLITVSMISTDLRYFYAVHIICDLFYLLLLRWSVKRVLVIAHDCTWTIRDLSNLSSIFNYTLGILLISVVALVNRQLDKVVISKYLSLTELGAYNAATTLGNLTAIIPSAIYIAVFPRFTKSATTGDDEKLSNSFRMVNRAVSSVVSFLMAFIGVFSIDLILLWTGSTVYADLLGVVGCLVVLAVGVTEFQEIPYALALAYGNTRINVLVGVSFIPLVAVGTVFGIKTFGLVGAGVVYVVMASLQTIVYLFLVYRKHTCFNPLMQIVIDNILPVFLAFGCALLCKHVIYSLTDSLVIHIVAGVVFGAASLFVYVFAISRGKNKFVLERV